MSDVPVYMFVYLCMHSCMWRLRVHCSPLHSPEAPTVSELNPELASIAAQSSQLALSVPCFHFLSVVITREPQCLPGFYVGSGDLNSCPGTCSKHFNNQTIFIAHTWGLNGILC